MQKLFILISLLFLSCSIFSQELVGHQIGKNGASNFKFQKVDSFYYQIGVLDDDITIGFNSDAQVISGIGNNPTDQVYIVKYDLDFNIVWTHVIGSSGDASKLQMKYHEDYLYIFWAQVGFNNVLHYCHRVNINTPEDLGYILRFESGSYNASYDFEISEGGAIAVAGTYSDRIKFTYTGQANVEDEYFCNSQQNIFLVRYRFQGSGPSYSHIVQREWGNPGENKRRLSAIKFDANENIHLFGYGNGSVQLDGNSGEAIGHAARFQVTYSETNDLIQFKEVDLISAFPARVIPIDNNNYAFVGGYDQGVLDENMEVVSTNDIDYNTNQRLIDVAITEDSYTTLFQFQPSIYPLSLGGYTFKTNNFDYALINYDFNGNMNWYSYFGGDSQTDIPTSVDYLENGNLVVSGNTSSSLDIDPSHNVVKYDYEVDKFFVAEYSIQCNGLSTGLRNISQITCTEDAQLEFGINGGTSPYEFYFDNQLVSDFENIEVAETGVYQASVIDDEDCSKAIYVPITGPSLDPNEKLRLHQHASEFRTGFEASIYYSLHNKNCIPRSGKVRIVLDNEIEYINASQTPSSLDDQTLEFDYNELIYQDSIFKLNLDLKISEDAIFGNQVCARIYIYDAQGVEIDSDIICKEVINSYDPNDISVAPYGRCDENYFLENEELEYTIRFQNLGNAEAINVEIVDTLSTTLDINSFVQTGASHNATVHIEEDSILIIYFKDIYLPAEEQDEVASNGFFSYKIKVFENQDINTKINNRAAIYFDFNDPVITNTVRSTVIDDLPVCILTNVANIENNNTITYYPNPVTNILTIEHGESLNGTVELFDISGKRYNISMNRSQAKTLLDLSPLHSGIYFVKIDGFAIRFYKE